MTQTKDRKTTQSSVSPAWIFYSIALLIFLWSAVGYFSAFAQNLPSGILGMIPFGSTWAVRAVTGPALGLVCGLAGIVVLAIVQWIELRPIRATHGQMDIANLVAEEVAVGQDKAFPINPKLPRQLRQMSFLALIGYCIDGAISIWVWPPIDLDYLMVGAVIPADFSILNSISLLACVFGLQFAYGQALNAEHDSKHKNQ